MKILARANKKLKGNGKFYTIPEQESVLDSLIDKTITSIESNVTIVGMYVFNRCYSLTSASFPNATKVDMYAFDRCDRLTSISFPKATIINNQAFNGCSSLTSVSFPNVTNIGDSAFNGCRSLTSVSFPNVTNIKGSAFGHCLNCLLYDFRGVTQVPTLSNVNAFYNTSSSKKIVVPDALYDEWITATNWSSTENNIVSSIIKASDYEASL